MPDAWVADPWHVSLSPTIRQLLVELECSARGVLLPAWSSSVCGGMSRLLRAQVGSTPQDYPQESLWDGSMPSYMVVQQPLTVIKWLDSMSRMYWMVRSSRNHSDCRGHGQNTRSGPVQYCEVGSHIPPHQFCPSNHDHHYRKYCEPCLPGQEDGCPTGRMEEGIVGNLCDATLQTSCDPPRNEALAILVPTSPEPYRGDGK